MLQIEKIKSIKEKVHLNSIHSACKTLLFHNISLSYIVHRMFCANCIFALQDFENVFTVKHCLLVQSHYYLIKNLKN